MAVHANFGGSYDAAAVFIVVVMTAGAVLTEDRFCKYGEHIDSDYGDSENQ